MTLHPGLMALFFILFALLAIPPLLTYLKARRIGFAALMVITIFVCTWTAWIVGHASAAPIK